MKKILISIIGVLIVSLSYAETHSNNFDNVLYENISSQNDDIVVYRLFRTQNMWTFIKLNTRNGKIWQVQYDVEGDNRIESYLNILPLVSKDKEVNGRFTLHATKNMWTFILIDQVDGKVWQVQWSIEFENRGIIPIE